MTKVVCGVLSRLAQLVRASGIRTVVRSGSRWLTGVRCGRFRPKVVCELIKISRRLQAFGGLGGVAEPFELCRSGFEITISQCFRKACGFGRSGTPRAFCGTGERTPRCFDGAFGLACARFGRFGVLGEFFCGADAGVVRRQAAGGEFFLDLGELFVERACPRIGCPACWGFLDRFRDRADFGGGVACFLRSLASLCRGANGALGNPSEAGECDRGNGGPGVPGGAEADTHRVLEAGRGGELLRARSEFGDEGPLSLAG